MTGTISLDSSGQGKFYCRWHFRGLRHPTDAQDEAMFSDWWQQQETFYGRPPYCTEVFDDKGVWTYPAIPQRTIWAAINGHEPLEAEPPEPDWVTGT